VSESESALPRPAVFAVASISLVVVFAAAGAPIPLLVSLGAGDGGGRADLAGVATAYFAGTLGALLVFGRVSDHIGRRPMVVAAILSAAAASGITAATEDVSVFVAARVLQGVSIGFAASAIGALVVDMAPRRAPWLGATVAAAAAPVGVPVGVLAMSLWFDTVDAVLTVLCVLLVACAVVVVVGVGAGRRRPGALRSLLPRFSSPRSRRAHVVAVFVATGSMWGFGGVHQTFGPTIAADAFGETSPLVGGLVFIALPLGTPLGAILIGLLGPRRSVMVGAVGSAVGVAGVWAAVNNGALPGFVVSCALVGASQAAVLGGAAAWILARTDIEHRAGALATYSFVSYGSAAAAAGLISAAHPSSGPSSVLPVAAVATVAATLLILGLFRLPDASNENAR
jgi:MFS family permease